MIRRLRIWAACRKLQRIVNDSVNSFDREQYRRRRAAALKGMERA